MMKILTCSILVLIAVIAKTAAVAYTCDQGAWCGCSKRSTVFLSKIIGGEAVQAPHTWGWIGSLRRDEMHICGASLITPDYAITAAHCVPDIDALSRLSLNFGINNLSYTGEIHNIKRITVHPLYDPVLFINDLALLHLETSIDSRRTNTSLICLPTIPDSVSNVSPYPPIGQNLIAIGWGTTDPYVRSATPMLRQVTVKAIARSDVSCDNTINDDKVQFCAGVPEGGKDTCYGDSGGPLMMFNDGQWHLIGVTSYGSNCAFPGFAGVYTRVTSFSSFIQKIITSDDPFFDEGKVVIEENSINSHAQSLFQVSFLSILLCLFSVKYFDFN